MKKAVVLSSGGLDSTVCLGLAVQKYGRSRVTALNVYYGQRHSKEVEASKRVADYYGVERIELDLAPCFIGGKSSLIDPAGHVPHASYHEQYTSVGRLSTVVPFRNGLFISAAVCMMLGRLEEKDSVDVVLGNHAGDVEHYEYPDCSMEFINHMRAALDAGTSGAASIWSPFATCTKTEVIKQGIAIDAPLGLTWSCYMGGDVPCGRCGTCQQRAAAFRALGITDPAL